ncbi:MAG TPA: hypothetical protein EYO85_03185, partial [Rhodospirillales bacterium]|nr:hypothetical protein [Rhodospirillales bacterium]
MTASIPIPTATGVFQTNSGYILAPAELEQTIVGLLNNSNSESLLAAIASLTGDENISLVFDNESQQFRTAAAIPVPTATPTPLPPGFPTPTPTPTPIPTPTATPGSTIPPGTIFTLTTGASPSSGGTVSPSGTNSYAAGTEVTVTQSQSGGYNFTGWSGDCSGSGSCVVTMNATRQVTGNFVQPSPPT